MMSEQSDTPVPAPPSDADLSLTAICHLEATEVAANRSAVGIADADRVSVELGALGMAIADEVTVSQAIASRVIARTVETEQTLVGTLLAGRVTFRRASASLVLIAGRVDGDVRTVLDWRGALAAGAAIGVAIGLLRRRS
jgi:hypothetical protein